MKKLLVLLLVAGNAFAGNWAGNFGAALRGQQEYEEREAKLQCMRSCRDSQCYDTCNGIVSRPTYDQEMQQRLEQPLPDRVPQIDYSCVNLCQQKYPNVQIQTCWAWCSH